MSLNTDTIKSFIDLNIKEIKTVHCVARMLNVSYDTLRKTFLRKERVPLADYIMAKKVEVMKEHLVVANDPCFVICYEYGLREDSGAKIFKRVTGMTMRQYRKYHRTH
jgi:methylphosphotriester-DNA--protein-cysteine methyltransferase